MSRTSGIGGARRILARRRPEFFGYRVDALGRVAERVARVTEAAREHVHLAWELLRLQDGLDDEEELALMLAVVALLESVEQGSTRLPLSSEALDEQVRPWWTPDEVEAVLRLAGSGRAATLLGSAGDDRPLLVARGCLYMHRMYVQETMLADALAAMMRRPASQYPSDALEGALATIVQDGAGLALSSEQQRALSTAARAPLCVVSGGPGTGKTSIVVSMLRLFLQLGVGAEAIALCAPTGKAAHRLAGSIGAQLARMADLMPLERQLLRRVPAPRTVHRVLGYSPGEQRFKHDAHRPLQHALVVVDEASMVDLELMEHLVRALGPTTRLVLLGDADQLPSVEAGAVLRDLIPGARGPALAVTDDAAPEPVPDDEAAHPMAALAVRLTRSYRMDPSDPDGRHILTVASQIVAGQTDYLHAPEGAEAAAHRRGRAAEVCFGGVELLAGGSGVLADLLERWFEERSGSGGMLARASQLFHFAGGRFDARDAERIGELLAHVEAFRVLCLTRVGPRGTQAINARLHAQWVARLGLDGAPPAFVPGEPVMMLRNDYDKGLFNGDTGLVLRVALEHDGAQRSIMAVFPRASGELGVYHLDALRGEVELAHAITVHKSQGSEYRDVLFVLPERDGPLLTREMLYTAVTRARRSVVVAGDEVLLGQATLRQVHRHSGITERLAELAATP